MRFWWFFPSWKKSVWILSDKYSDFLLIFFWFLLNSVWIVSINVNVWIFAGFWTIQQKSRHFYSDKNQNYFQKSSEKYLEHSQNASRIIQNVFRTHSECFQNTFRMYPESFRTHSECIQNTFRMYSEHIQNVFRTHSECIQNTFRMHSEWFQNTFRMFPEYIQNVFQNTFRMFLNSSRIKQQKVYFKQIMTMTATLYTIFFKSLWNSTGIPMENLVRIFYGILYPIYGGE